jgi:hypothetical protein
MKRTVTFLAALLVASFLVGQTPNAPASPSVKVEQKLPLADYAGDWNSTLNGKVWLHLQLVLHGEKITGEMMHAKDLRIDDSGGLTSVSDEQSSQTVADAVLNPDGLVLTFKDADTQESDRFLMRLAAASKQNAELRVIGVDMPPGMAKPKPWRLEKAGAASSSPK